MRKALIGIAISLILIVLIGGAECNSGVTPGTSVGSESFRLVLFQDDAGFFSVLVPQGVTLTNGDSEFDEGYVYYQLFDPIKENMVTLSLNDLSDMIWLPQNITPSNIASAQVFGLLLSGMEGEYTNFEGPIQYNGGSYYTATLNAPEIGHPVNFAVFIKEAAPKQFASLGVIINDKVTKDIFLQMIDSFKVLKTF